MTGSSLDHGCGYCSLDIPQVVNFVCRTCVTERVHRSSFDICGAAADYGTGFKAPCIDAGQGLDRRRFIQQFSSFCCIVKMNYFQSSSGSRSFLMESNTGSDFAHSVDRRSSAYGNFRIPDFGSVAASFGPGLDCTLDVPCSAVDCLRVSRELATGVENRAGNLFVQFGFSHAGAGSVP